MRDTRSSADLSRMIAAPADGVFYVGRPRWLTSRVLDELVVESDQLRPDAVLVRRQLHVPGGPAARRFAQGPELFALIARHAGPVSATGAANYLYYERTGDGIDPHIDQPGFELQVLMTLRHDYERQSESALALFSDGPSPRRIHQQPGELVLFWAAAVVHARTRLGNNESVCNLGIGYKAGFTLPNPPYWRPSALSA